MIKGKISNLKQYKQSNEQERLAEMQEDISDFYNLRKHKNIAPRSSRMVCDSETPRIEFTIQIKSDIENISNVFQNCASDITNLGFIEENTENIKQELNFR